MQSSARPINSSYLDSPHHPTNLKKLVARQSSLRYSLLMTNRKPQATVTIIVTAKDFGTREMTFRDMRRNSAEEQAAHWTKVLRDAGHVVTRK